MTKGTAVVRRGWLLKEKAIVNGERIVSQQPPCPLTTALSLTTTLPFVILTGAKRSGGTCGAPFPQTTAG
jgi:hypothetical protein